MLTVFIYSAAWFVVKGCYMKILIGVFMFVSSSVSNAKNLISVEWAPFVKAVDVTEQQLLVAADKVNVDFLSKQPGFIKRELIKKNDTEYADVIHWRTKQEAVTAGDKIFSCDECSDYFKLMDMESSAEAGKGFSHYEILQSWE